MLGPRDEALLRALARFRCARTKDLTALFFHGIRPDTAAVRLRRLHDGGFIEARSLGLSEQNVYRLGPAGRSWAEERGIAAAPPPLPPAAHHLSIVGAWARLAAALAAHETLRLQRFTPDWELRRDGAGASVPVIPDAAIEIASRSGAPETVRLALEVDLATEGLRVLQRKLGAYDASRYFDGEGEVTLVVVLLGARERRVAAVQSLLAASAIGRGLVVLDSQWPDAILQRLREAPLTSSPCGKGSTAAATSRGAVETRRQGEGLSE